MPKYLQPIPVDEIEGGWSRQTRTFVLTLSVVGFIWLLYVGQAMIGPLVISALLAYVLNPVVSFVNQRTKLPRSLVVALLYAIFLAILVGVSVSLAPVVVQQSQDLTNELESAMAQLQEAVEDDVIILGFTLPLDEVVDDLLAAPEVFAQSDRVLQIVNSATTNIVWVAIILIVTFYLLLDWHQLREWIIGLAPPRFQGDTRRLYEKIRDIWQAYLGGTLVLMFIIGFMTFISLLIIGMPGALALGVLTGVLDAILSIGPAVAMVIAAIVAWFQGPSYLPVSNQVFVLIVLGVYGAIQALENVWLRPRIMGSRLHMHPAVVFLAIVAALTLVGAVGALIVLPILGTMSVIGSYVRCRVLGLDPWANDNAQANEAQSEEELEMVNGNDTAE